MQGKSVDISKTFFVIFDHGIQHDESYNSSFYYLIFLILIYQAVEFWPIFLDVIDNSPSNFWFLLFVVNL